MDRARGVYWLYHDTDRDSAVSFLEGHPLDLEVAAKLKSDGPPGFLLASEYADAEFFAIRRRLPVVLSVVLSVSARENLLEAGAIIRPIAMGSKSPRFSGPELFIPITAFGIFNDLRRIGEIEIEP